MSASVGSTQFANKTIFILVLKVLTASLSKIYGGVSMQNY